MLPSHRQVAFWIALVSLLLAMLASPLAKGDWVLRVMTPLREAGQAATLTGYFEGGALCRRGSASIFCSAR